MRVGFGYDVHRLVTGRPLVLGGVHIPSEKGLQGHSDADVLSHAIVDALLGALALGDIGQHFPDTDPRWKDVRSLDFLKKAAVLVADRGYKIVNVDAVIQAEAPRLANHIPHMRQNIASALGIEIGCVSVKATTGEGLGFVGRQEGIAAQAVALLTSK